MEPTAQANAPVTAVIAAAAAGILKRTDPFPLPDICKSGSPPEGRFCAAYRAGKQKNKEEVEIFQNIRYNIFAEKESQEVCGMQDRIYQQTKAVMEELGQKARLKAGNIVVIGCSTSEVLGAKIGSNSSPETAKQIFEALREYARIHGVYLAVQCCEHLNRAIVTERAAVPGAEIVNAVPQPKAGGSLAAQAYAGFADPVVVEEIRADAGIDIGLTLIGMHLKKVAVPLRLENNRIGEATVVAARTRPKFIGGSRAVYNEEWK